MKPSLEVEKSLSELLPAVYPEAADLIVSYLEQIGVEYVFGVPGGAIEPLYNALARSERRGRIIPVVARHESGAAFMADGYARDSGLLGVCCTTTGPGVTNAITGIASAYQDDIPMLVITAQTPLDSFGRGAVQESSCTAIDTVAMLRHCTHYNTLVSHPAQLEYKLCAAITMAVQARGPVHLSVPLDILRMLFEASGPRRRLDWLLHRPRLSDADAMNTLSHKVRQAKRPIVVVGEACRSAAARVIAFAERSGALLITTPQGKGLIDPYHSHYRGGCGLAGHHSARDLLLNAGTDLIMVVGSCLDEQAGQGWLHDNRLRGKLVHIDELARHFIRSQHADMHVCGDIDTIFETLTAGLSAVETNTLLPWDVGIHSAASRGGNNVVLFERRVRDRRRPEPETEDKQSERRNHDRRMVATAVPPFKRSFTLTDEQRCYSSDSPIKPQRLMHELSRLMPPGTRFLADIGNSFLWGLHYLHPVQYDASSCDYFRTSMGFASMGWAIGAAVGTALSDSTRPVVCLVGDGSYLMSGQEITVALMHELPVIFMILNDQALGTVKHGQRLARAERVGFELPAVNYANMAQAMGIDAYTVYSATDLINIDIPRILRRRAPTLIDVHVDGKEIPPLSERMDMLALPF